MARFFMRPLVPGEDKGHPVDIFDVIDPVTYEPREGWIELTKQADNGVALAPSIEAGVVNALQEECGRTAAEHGFSGDWEAAAWLEELADDLDNAEHVNPSDIGKLRDIAAILRKNILGTTTSSCSPA